MAKDFFFIKQTYIPTDGKNKQNIDDDQSNQRKYRVVIWYNC